MLQHLGLIQSLAILRLPKVSLFAYAHQMHNNQYALMARNQFRVYARTFITMIPCAFQDLVEVLSDPDAWNTPRKKDQSAYERNQDGTFTGWERTPPLREACHLRLITCSSLACSTRWHGHQKGCPHVYVALGVANLMSCTALQLY